MGMGRYRSWSALVVGVVLALIGLVLAIGNAWLAILGGSLYYLITGVAMIVAGGLFVRERIDGGWLYIAIVLLTVLWAFWEVGSNPRAMVPRVIAPIVLLVAVLVVMPTLSIAANRWRNGPIGVAATLFATVVLFTAIGTRDNVAVVALSAPMSAGMADPSCQSTGPD